MPTEKNSTGIFYNYLFIYIILKCNNGKTSFAATPLGYKYDKIFFPHCTSTIITDEFTSFFQLTTTFSATVSFIICYYFSFFCLLIF